MRTDVLAGFSPYVRVSGLFRREYIPYVCDAKAHKHLEGWIPTLGQGPATWIRYTRCTPAKTKIDLHIIFLVCHRWVCDHCQGTKIPIWGVVADVSSFHML